MPSELASNRATAPSHMCKAEKTQLNDRVAIGGFCVQRTVADKVQKIGT